MSLKKPKNENYCANIAKIRNIIPIENCDNLVHANILGNSVIVGKDTKIGDIGIFFPPETKLSNDFLRENNLFRKKELNIDQTKKGYFDEKGRVKCVKLRGNKSMGIFLPISSLNYTKHTEDLNINDSFDEINGINICEKYIIRRKLNNSTKEKKSKKANKVSRLVDGQFRFHIDVDNLGKNIWKFKPDDLIHISTKLHGTSVVISRVLCKKKQNIILKILKKFGMPIYDKEYYNLVSSRKVVKNDDISKKKINNYYDEDIWVKASKSVQETLKDGMTYYGEIIGYLGSGSFIQKDYDYGCEKGEHKLFIYRITYTNPSGNVYEFSMHQVETWCKFNGLNCVPKIYYGYAGHLFQESKNLEKWQNDFLDFLTKNYLGKKSKYCKNDVPEEGIVVRRETIGIDSYKWKSFEFLEKETKLLDSNKSNIEDDQS